MNITLYKDLNKTNVSFGLVAKELLRDKQLRVVCGDLHPKSAEVFEQRYKKYFSSSFGDVDIRALGYSEFESLVTSLANERTARLSNASIAQIIGVGREILSFAYRRGYTQGIPPLPKIKPQVNPRRSLNPSELLRIWRVLRRADANTEESVPARRSRRDGIFAKNYSVPAEVKWIIPFCVNTFLRPHDLKNLRNEHVEVIKCIQQRYLRLTPPTSKGHSGPMISRPTAAWVYDRILAENNKIGLAGRGDHVFLPTVPDREAAMLCLTKVFARAVSVAGILLLENNRRVTLYSLRHTAITQQLLRAEKCDLLTLAKNARTSVAMIEKFYSFDVRPEQNLSTLHSKRKRT